MNKILIYAEGPTEERFIKNQLNSHLEKFNLHAIPVLVTTKVVKSGSKFKGGTVKYSKAKKELQSLLGDTSACAVTTMLDYYGLHVTFPGRASPQGKNCYEYVDSVEQTISEDIGNRKFIPFLTLHEFEGLLFSAPDVMAKTLPDGEHLAGNFSAIRNKFKTPEEINDDPKTSPHRRVEDLYSQYKKPLHGTAIAANIGLNKIRNECPHFDEWLTKLESLSS